MSDPSRNEERQAWLRGESPGEGADEFARQAARGREELASPEAAGDLLGELDDLIAARFGAPATDAEKNTSADTSTGAAESAGAKTIPLGKDRKRVRPLRTWYAAAAAILLLVIAGYWWTTQETAFDAEAAYATAFTPYANELSSRTMGEEDPTVVPIDATLAAALLAYDRRDFRSAADSFALYLRLAPAAAPKEGPTLYYGISQLAAGQAKAAASTLASLEEDATYGQPARWYHALALLRQEDVAGARSILTTLAANDRSLFRERARQLLNTLP